MKRVCRKPPSAAKPALTAMVAVSVLLACAGPGGAGGAGADRSPGPVPDGGQISKTEAADDIQRGTRLYRKCVNCHSLEPNGRNIVGPRLFGLFGRVSGSVAGYKYSTALKAARITWDEATLDAYLANSTQMVPGTKMYAFMSRERDRADLIAYLKTATGDGAARGKP